MSKPKFFSNSLEKSIRIACSLSLLGSSFLALVDFGSRLGLCSSELDCSSDTCPFVEGVFLAAIATYHFKQQQENKKVASNHQQWSYTYNGKENLGHVNLLHYN
jgi:hypothetical protein